jgi:hypothetical protein
MFPSCANQFIDSPVRISGYVAYGEEFGPLERAHSSIGNVDLDYYNEEIEGLALEGDSNGRETYLVLCERRR